jgi:hypothetical protein
VNSLGFVYREGGEEYLVFTKDIDRRMLCCLDLRSMRCQLLQSELVEMEESYVEGLPVRTVHDKIGLRDGNSVRFVCAHEGQFTLLRFSLSSMALSLASL